MTNRYFLTLVLLFSPVITLCQKTTSIQADFTGSDIKVDGILNEDPWKQSRAVSDFLQHEPDEGSPSARKTEVRVLFGKDDLYVGATMFDNPENIEKNLGRRDIYNRADWFMVSVDSYFNGRTAYTFAVNAAGVQLDGHIYPEVSALTWFRDMVI